MTTTSPVEARNPAQTAAPFPMFVFWKRTWTPSFPSSSRRMSRVPSFEPSSTMTSSFSSAPTSAARTRPTISRIVLRSLYAGITIDSFKAGITPDGR